MEVFPPKKDTDFEMVKEAALHIASLKPSFMSVTYGAGGSTKGNTIKLASEIQKQYQVPAMAHLTCVCATKESINTALTEMKQAGIENILALRGDIPKDYDGEVFTEFQHASQLVELIKKTGDFCVGGACYPEVHPDSKNKFDDINGLKEKVKAGCEFLGLCQQGLSGGYTSFRMVHKEWLSYSFGWQSFSPHERSCRIVERTSLPESSGWIRCLLGGI